MPAFHCRSAGAVAGDAAGRAAVKAMDDPQYLQQLEKVGMEPFYMSPEAFLDFARKAFAAEKEVVERLGLAAGK